MKKKHVFTLVLACGALAFSVIGTGCKKEEKAKETIAPTAQQAVPSAAAAVTKEFTFEDGTAGWKHVGKGIKLAQASGQKHGGNAGLKISGMAGVGVWNFAASPTFSLESGKKYRLSGWMMVESTSAPKNPPFLKCAVLEDKTWRTNANTKKYNLGKMKEWQELSVEFTAPSDQNLNGFIAVEKGTNQSDITATIFVDDVKLETIQ